MQPNEAHNDEYDNGNKTGCESLGYRATFQLFPQEAQNRCLLWFELMQMFRDFRISFDPEGSS
jgi:hypothetical protein